MTSSEQYAAAASQLRAATEKAAELWKQGAQALSEQAEQLAKLPQVDPAAGVDRYFELLQQAVDVNRELAGKWASAVSSMSEVFSRRVSSVGEVAQQQADAVSKAVADQAGSAERTVADTSARVKNASAAAERQVRERSAAAEQAVQDTLAKVQQDAAAQARRARAAERPAAKKAGGKTTRAGAATAADKAREPYLGLTKAALSAKLAERSLPKSGTLAELIERLVESDRTT